MSTSRELFIGTSGWHYDHWVGPFYPDDMASEAYLSHYAERLSAVEINHSFYHLPEEKALEMWRDTVPADFTFCVKASRYITHMKKLKDPEEPLRTLYERLEALEDKLGPILFQLPPNWRFNRDRLAAFTRALSDEHRHVFEFRDPSWFVPEAYEILSRHDAAFCIYHLAGRQSPREVTTDLVYIRLHGPGEAYKGRYGNSDLSGWIGACTAWQRQGHTVHCYFDNDEAGYAVKNAMELQEMAPS